MVNPIPTTSVSVGFETLATNPLRTILSTLGIMLGVVAAITAIMRHVANAPMRAWLSASTVVTAIGASVAIGLIFGLDPALRAARLSPIDAIHHE
jgi:putative ABC transport system permease protein